MKRTWNLDGLRKTAKLRSEVKGLRGKQANKESWKPLLIEEEPKVKAKP